MKRIVIVGLTLLALPAWSADLSVPNMELITRGYLDSGQFYLTTRGDIDLEMAGGYKFGGGLSLNLNTDNLGYRDPDPLTSTASNADIVDYLNSQATLTFSRAEVVMRSVFGSPLNITYFIGRGDVIASGDIFPELFGSIPIATNYSGYLYFPDGVQYDGIQQVNGTGLSVAADSVVDWGAWYLYLYQDGYLGNGYYSADVRNIMNFDQVKLEAFVGATYPGAKFGLYRGGVMLFFKPGDTGEFITQIGVPRWDPWSEALDISNFYFLFEPRVYFDPLGVTMTFFWHPQYYHQVATDELGSADMNLNFLIGRPEVSPLSGGVETTVNFRTGTGASDQLKAVISPYLSMLASGVIWNFKVNATLWPFDLANIAEAFVGIRAEF